MKRVIDHSVRLAALIEDAIKAADSVPARLVPRERDELRVGRALVNRRLAVEVLAALLESGTEESYGYDLARVCGSPTGSVYKVLDFLEADGLIASRREDPELAAATRRQPRVYYRLTDAGERALGAWRAIELHRSPASRLIN